MLDKIGCNMFEVLVSGLLSLLYALYDIHKECSMSCLQRRLHNLLVRALGQSSDKCTSVDLLPYRGKTMSTSIFLFLK